MDAKTLAERLRDWRHWLSNEAADLLLSQAAERDALRAERDALKADAELWRRIDSHGLYWLENRGGILDCLTRNGYELLSSSSGWTLHKIPARTGGKA
jgi:hypothetical protein